MYQVLQVYTSFSFFANFLSRSIKVGQSSSRRRSLRVAETSRIRRRNFFSIIWSRAGLRDVAETSSSSKTYLVAATSPRPNGDLKKSPKSRRKNRTCLISPRLPRDPPILQETSRRRLRDPRRLESPTGRQLVSIRLHASEIGAYYIR